MAPFTGLAAAIRAAGHSVTITSNDEYESLVVGCRLEFRPLPGTHGMFDDPRLMRVVSGPASAVGVIRLIAECIRTVHKAVVAVARQDAPDVLALSGITAAGGYRIAEGLGLPGMDLLLQPVHTTVDFPPSIAASRSFGRLGNRVAGMATNAPLEAMAGPAGEIRRELGLSRARDTRSAVRSAGRPALAGVPRLQPCCRAAPGGLARRLRGIRLLVAAAAGRVEPAG